ncbi:MAG: protein phosphatase 2C domain-containing protein [Chromatiales bacterium]|nr:serine/threonine-protein phosphatase [Gammaproteobacteria bacterium]
MVQAHKLDLAYRSETGPVRKSNQDTIGTDEAAGIVIVADGMGGANGGEIASQLAVDLLMQYFTDDERNPIAESDHQLQESLSVVNNAILEAAEQMPELQGMGTTLVLGMFDENHLRYAHVGDSRLYRLRNGKLTPLTRDHSLIEDMIDKQVFSSSLEAIEAGVPRNILSKAFGTAPNVEADIAKTDLKVGDIYLFCSDGLTSIVSDEKIEDELLSTDKNLIKQVDELIENACNNGGTDNVSIVLVSIDEAA